MLSSILSKKRTEKFDFTTMVPQVELFSFVFWENFEINRPLHSTTIRSKNLEKKIVKSLSAKTKSSHCVNPRDNASSRCDKVIFCLRPFYIHKGQLISKCLFGFFNSPKKQTKKFDFTTMVYLKSNCFRSYFGRIEETKKTFRN